MLNLLQITSVITNYGSFITNYVKQLLEITKSLSQITRICITYYGRSNILLKITATNCAIKNYLETLLKIMTGIANCGVNTTYIATIQY